MKLDIKTKILIQLSAAISTNALVKIRESFKEALDSGISLDAINETITLALQVQQQPITHSEHLIHQLMRESNKKNDVQGKQNYTHANSCTCGCGSNHKHS